MHESMTLKLTGIKAKIAAGSYTDGQAHEDIKWLIVALEEK